MIQELHLHSQRRSIRVANHVQFIDRRNQSAKVVAKRNGHGTSKPGRDVYCLAKFRRKTQTTLCCLPGLEEGSRSQSLCKSMCSDLIRIQRINQFNQIGHVTNRKRQGVKAGSAL